MRNEQELKSIATRIRIDCTNMFHNSHNGHFGGSFSCTEIVTALYFDILNIKPEDPKWPDRDRFIISKGHGAPAVYSALQQRGFFPKSYIDDYEKLCSNLSTHPNMHKIPGIDVSSGSLGHGLSVGAGMALAGKKDKKNYHVFVLLGDGECNEGMVWEAAMAAAHLKLDNLIAIVDRNHLCVGGNTEEVMALEPFNDKWRSFGFDLFNIDGHNYESIFSAFDAAMNLKNGKPKCIMAETVKGKGVSFMEGNASWHGAHFNDETYEKIMCELSMTAPDEEAK